MEIPTKQNHVYTLTCENACEVYDVDTDRLIHEHHAGEVQSQFTAIGMKSRTSDDTAIVTEVFNGASVGNGAGGGYIESDLHVGHGAADAVQAVCTLTLGDPAAAGDLADNAGHELHLDAQPLTAATGRIATEDPACAGSISIGGWTREFPAAPQTEDSAEATPVADFRERKKFAIAAYVGDDNVGGWYPEEFESPQSTVAALAWAIENMTWSGVKPFAASASGGKVVLTALPQFHGQRVSLRREDYDGYVFPFEGNEIVLEGGADARTDADIVREINEDADNDAVVAVLGADNYIHLTAKTEGAAGNGGITLTDDDPDYTLWHEMTPAPAMSGGQDARTYAEVIAAINAETDFGVTAAATETEGTITLTANTAGAAANAVVYTATGCFGSGTVKQGSTTRGRNAVEQTDYEFVLNGEPFQPEIDVDDIPTQGSGNAVSSGGVYAALTGGVAGAALAERGYLPLDAGVAPEVKGNVTFSGTTQLGSVSKLTVSSGRIGVALSAPEAARVNTGMNFIGYYSLPQLWLRFNQNLGVALSNSCLMFNAKNVVSNQETQGDVYCTDTQDNFGVFSKVVNLRGSKIKMTVKNGAQETALELNAADLLKLRQILDETQLNN